MENKTKIEEIKRLIGSVLISHQNGIKLRLFPKEYKNIVGEDLPFRELGFNSVYELLKDFNDCVGFQIQANHRNDDDFIVYALKDIRTQHIQELVDKQKADNHKLLLNPLNKHLTERRINNRIKSCKPYSLDVKQIDDLDTNSQINQLMNRLNQKKVKNKPVCGLPDSRVIPMDERKKIKQLMNKFYKGINLWNFSSIYRSLYGFDLNFERFGFQYLELFLSDLSDIVKLVYFEDNKCRVMPIESNLNSIQSNDCFHKPEEGISHESTHSLHEDCENSNNHSIISLQKEKKNSKNGTNNGFHKDMIRELIPQKELENFKTILRLNPEGIAVNEFMDQYFRRFGVPFIASKWGFGSALEMVCALDNIFLLKNPENGNKDMDEWLLFESNPIMRAKDIENRPKKKRFDQCFKSNVLKIMEKINSQSKGYSDFSFSDFINCYEFEFNEKIDAKEFGYRNLKDLFIALSKEIDIEVKEKVKGNPFLICKTNRVKN
jgi:hypothetical protein